MSDDSAAEHTDVADPVQATMPESAPVSENQAGDAAPVRFPVTLDEFCRDHSKVRRGEVELLTAFHTVMTNLGKTAPQTEDAFLAEFKDFESSHKPI